MTDMESMDAAGGCRGLLRALAAGRLGDWDGLAEDCRRPDAEAALGPSEEGEDGVGNLGGQMTAFREYPGTDFAPFGLLVWYEGDEILAVQINQPIVKDDLQHSLGPPEEKGSSKLKAFHEQWIYSSRGLSFHVHEGTGAVFRLYAFPPMRVEAYLNSPLSRVSVRREPRRY